MPVGLQLIGNYFSEAKLLNAAHRFQQATDFHLKSPVGIYLSASRFPDDSLAAGRPLLAVPGSGRAGFMRGAMDTAH
jgi:hypothetical protein